MIHDLKGCGSEAADLGNQAVPGRRLGLVVVNQWAGHVRAKQ